MEPNLARPLAGPESDMAPESDTAPVSFISGSGVPQDVIATIPDRAGCGNDTGHCGATGTDIGMARKARNSAGQGNARRVGAAPGAAG